jgi:hypothetical protein
MEMGQEVNERQAKDESTIVDMPSYAYFRKLMSAVGAKRRGDGEPQGKVRHAKIVKQMPRELIDEQHRTHTRDENKRGFILQFGHSTFIRHRLF